MKKVLRSVLDVDGQISQEELMRNYTYLSQSSLSLVDEEDMDIWNYIQHYAPNYSAIPTLTTLQDFFEKNGELTVIDRLGEIKAFRRIYKNSDFENLVDEEVKAQKDQEMQVVLQTAATILFEGMDIKEGRDTVTYKGHKGAMQYVMAKADDMLASDRGFRTKTNVPYDTEEMRDEFNRVLSAKKKSWGVITGLRDIDQVCRGIKPGELWTHAGFTSEFKCCTAGQYIFNHDTKKLETVGQLYTQGTLPTVTALYREGAEPRLVTAKASHLIENGVQPVFRITLKSGRSVELTDNHPLWTAKGGGTWRELGAMVVGDYIGIPKIMRVPNFRTDFTNEEVKAYGYLIGDGSLKNGISLTATLPEVREDFTACLNALGYREGRADYQTPTYSVEFPEERAPYVRVSHSAGLGNSDMVSPLRSRLEELGLWGTTSKTKHIPSEFFGLPDDQIALLLGALWSTDGSCHSGEHNGYGRNDITYATTSSQLASGVQMLLTRLGIESTVVANTSTYKGEAYRFHTVRVVTNPSKRAFCDLVRVVGKEDRFHTLKGNLNTTDDRLFPTTLLAGLEDNSRALSPTGSWRYARHAKARATITAEGLRIFSQLDPTLEQHLGGDVVWDQIASIEAVGEEMTYDLSVPEHHSFVVNDVITHNTSFALNWVYRAVFLLQYNVYYLSLEMSIEQLRRLIYVMHSNHPKFQGQGNPKITYRLIRDGEDENEIPISEEQKEFYLRVIDDVEENRGTAYGSLFIRSPDEDYTVSKMRADMELTHQKHPLHMAVVDHVALMKPETSNRNFYTDLNSIVRDTKRLALSFNGGEMIPVLSLLQINRTGKAEADKAEGVYKMQALADSNEAERSSDVITTSYLNRELRDTNLVKFGCLKNRDNPHFRPFTAGVDWTTRYLFNDFDTHSDHRMMNATSQAAMTSIIEEDAIGRQVVADQEAATEADDE